MIDRERDLVALRGDAAIGIRADRCIEYKHINRPSHATFFDFARESADALEVREVKIDALSVVGPLAAGAHEEACLRRAGDAPKSREGALGAPARDAWRLWRLPNKIRAKLRLL